MNALTYSLGVILLLFPLCLVACIKCAGNDKDPLVYAAASTVLTLLGLMFAWGLRLLMSH